MNIASNALCKELFELSGWKIEQGYGWRSDGIVGYPWQYPAYDLGYLLKKLPGTVSGKAGGYYALHLQYDASMDSWKASYGGTGVTRQYVKVAREAENCVVRLAIELFKQGILKREES
jgi:hypothetical protein